MQDVQESILSLSFSRQILKSISDKISNYLDKNAERDEKNNGKNDKINGRNGRNGGGTYDGKHKDKDQEVIYNSDKSNPHWRLQEGENFSKIFYNCQKDCPKKSDNKLNCMKFFVRGVCDKSCNRAHSLSKDNSKKFEKFLADCREEAAKKDF